MTPQDERTLRDLGITVTQDFTEVRCLGKLRKSSSLETYEKWLLGLSNSGLAVVVAFTLFVVATTSGTDLTFALLVVFNGVVSFFYTWKGVLQENASVMVVFIISAIVLSTYIVENFIVTLPEPPLNFTNDLSSQIKLARLCLLVLAVPIICLSVKAAHSYYCTKNLIFRTVGANLALQQACNTLHIAQSLLLFDFQLAASLVILQFSSGKYDELEIILVAVGLPFNLAWLILGYALMLRESACLLWIFWSLALFSPAFLIYRVFIVISQWSTLASDHLLDMASLICATLAVVMRVLVIVWSVKVYLNFGKGLKEHVHFHADDEAPILPDDPWTATTVRQHD